MGSECGQFKHLALFAATVADIAGCSDLGCKVDVVDQQKSGCTNCSIAKKRKIRRRAQDNNGATGFASKIRFSITATSSAGLDLSQVNQRLETNLASSNDKLNEAEIMFTAVTTTPQTASPNKEPVLGLTSSTTTVSHSNEPMVIHPNTKTQCFQTLLPSQTTTSSTGAVRDCFI